MRNLLQFLGRTFSEKLLKMKDYTRLILNITLTISGQLLAGLKANNILIAFRKHITTTSPVADIISQI